MDEGMEPLLFLIPHFSFALTCLSCLYAILLIAAKCPSSSSEHALCRRENLKATSMRRVYGKSGGGQEQLILRVQGRRCTTMRRGHIALKVPTSIC